MNGDAESEASPYPDIRDPRVMVAVPRERRPAVTALWAFAERLTKLLRDAREPMIGQIKLAWWRDMMALLARDPAALPKGEPLLAELQASWAGQVRLDTLVDAAEAMLLAEDDAGRRDAAAGFGEALFRLTGGAGGSRWGLVWGAGLQEGEREARQLLAEGRKNRDVGKALNISVKTAETHRARIMAKLGIDSVADLVRYAIRNGLIAP